MQLRWAYIGNFRPQHSTENHVASTLESQGSRVLRLQEDEAQTWTDLSGALERYDAQAVLWTRTWALDREMQTRALLKVSLPIVGFHLDRWWGLNREHQIHDEPFFTHSDLMVTADGGHDDRWVEAGVNHVWMPPAVYHVEALQAATALPRDQYRSEIGFVGSWSEYHAEWPWRRKLVEWLFATYPGRFKVWPRGQQEAVRGDALASLYHSVDVVVGDSCLAGGATHYWSDRVPETLGRGGFLLHPKVEGMEDRFDYGRHLGVFEPCSFADLRHQIDSYLQQPDLRAKIADEGRAHVLAHHTYLQRMESLTDVMTAQGLFRA